MSNRVLQTLEQDKQAIWTGNPDWSQQQRQQAWVALKSRLASYLAEDQPVRPAHQHTSSPAMADLGQDTRRGPMAIDIPNARKRSHESRTTTTIGQLLRTPSSQRPSEFAGPVLASAPIYNNQGITFGPGWQPVRDSISAGGTLDTSPAYPIGTGLASKSVDNAVMYNNPADFIARISGDAYSLSQSPCKKPRGESCSSSLLSPATSFGQHQPGSLGDDVISLGTSLDSCLSPASIAASRMSRQSSTISSFAGGFDMLKLSSNLSNVSELPFNFEFGDGNGNVSNVSCISDPSFFNFMDDIGNGSCSSAFSSSYNSTEKKDFLSVLPHSDDGREMSRSASQQSVSSTSSKKSARRRQHLINSKRKIVAKAESAAENEIVQNNTAINSHGHRPLKPQEPTQPRKEPIVKQIYIRPSHPKQRCNYCNDYPEGFRGEHELRRHVDRAHAVIRKVWICVQPPSGTGRMPEKPLGICKQCQQGKQYNVYYNAAAHLRRAHFQPRKRGRKAKGEERESRAGKAGGDWPPIEWLKMNGWLQEIEVRADQPLIGDLPVNVSQPYDEGDLADEDDYCWDMGSWDDVDINSSQLVQRADWQDLQPHAIDNNDESEVVFGEEQHLCATALNLAALPLDEPLEFRDYHTDAMYNGPHQRLALNTNAIQPVGQQMHYLRYN